MLKDTFYVPSFRRNLVSVSCLDSYDYSFEIKSNVISMFLNSNKVGYCHMSNELYRLSLSPNDIYVAYMAEKVVSKRQCLRKSLMHCGINVLVISLRIE